MTSELERSVIPSSIPRVSLGHFPTPLERLDRLSEELGGPELWIKRDDCTGLATGGNKTRKLEFLVADALAADADTLVTAGRLQSNHARQTAAAAAKFGLGCVLLLETFESAPSAEYNNNGNVFLDQLLGATIETVQPGELSASTIGECVDRLRREGRSPYVIPVGGSNATGALGYVDAAQELTNQACALDVDIDLLVLATGSCGTQAGLLAGFQAMENDVSVMGFSVSNDAETQRSKTAHVATKCAALLDQPAIGVSAVLVDDGYVGPGYGLPDAGTIEALNLFARTEAILLDPVYTAKAAAGLVDSCRTGRFSPNERVIFLHTGGHSADFAYRSVL